MRLQEVGPVARNREGPANDVRTGCAQAFQRKATLPPNRPSAQLEPQTPIHWTLAILFPMMGGQALPPHTIHGFSWSATDWFCSHEGGLATHARRRHDLCLVHLLDVPWYPSGHGGHMHTTARLFQSGYRETQGTSIGAGYESKHVDVLKGCLGNVFERVFKWWGHSHVAWKAKGTPKNFNERIEWHLSLTHPPLCKHRLNLRHTPRALSLRMFTGNLSPGDWGGGGGGAPSDKTWQLPHWVMDGV